MASVRCPEVQARPTECLDVTSVTRDEFRQRVPPVEAVFQSAYGRMMTIGRPIRPRRVTLRPTASHQASPTAFRPWASFSTLPSPML